MTGEQRAEAEVEVDVAVAVDVFHPRGLRPADDDRVRVVGLEARRHAERHHLAGSLGGLHRAGGALHVDAQFALGDLLRALLTSSRVSMDSIAAHSILQADFVLTSLPHHGIHRERRDPKQHGSKNESWKLGADVAHWATYMVAVVQLVERQFVVLDVAGSSPVGHPNRTVRGHTGAPTLLGS